MIMVCIFSTVIISSSLVILAACGPITPIARRTAALPPTIAGSSPSSNATLITYPWTINRDGGGGGTVAGEHIINFSDTQTLNQDNKNAAGFYPFVSNSIATSTKDGKTLLDYGTGYAKQQWPFATSNSPINGATTENAPSNYRTAIWPNTNIVTGCDGECGYTVSQVLNITYSPYTTTDLYTTVANITMPKGPSVNRIALKMWYPWEINWGTYGLVRARDGTNDIFLLAAPANAFGVKLARVPEASIADRTKYLFWNGNNWTAAPPAATDASSNIFSFTTSGYGVGTGDIFWSTYYNTWLAVFASGFAPDGTFRLMYSTNGNIAGPWSATAQDIYVTKGCPTSNGNCLVGYNYATHAYPDVDSTGKTLLLGWTYNGATTQFTTITFA
ncbi:hypothetical protein BT63DRAFT_429895 [Microthyrium microscopicum]|uniref:DUF4185 domain-containing protein n=1 Tax=Microthyrium microscopicum TaxID=703497 RepID=A0A6A6U0F8_9PEZI|nr:hypothetical protein BT63DRAFT_429895 [Microthyrium microscopicum]